MSEAPAAEPLRVCVVDDDPFVTASLATILSAEPDIVVAGEGHDGEEAVALFERERPDVLLMDIQMPGVGGLEAAERILAAHPEARIVFLTTFSDDEYIVRALRLGAKGYLIKQEVATIAPALRSVTAGQSVLGGEVLGRVDALMRGAVPPAPEPARLEALTEREREILVLVARGMTNDEIGAELFISPATVKTHLARVMAKLGAHDRAQLVVRAYEGGLVRPGARG